MILFAQLIIFIDTSIYIIYSLFIWKKVFSFAPYTTKLLIIK